MERPQIWSYRDPRAFLRDWCAWLAETDPNFSFRKLARWAELGSPNYVQIYLQGKRNLKPATARRIAEAAGLSPKEVEFFELLVRFDNARDDRERLEWYRRLLRRAVRDGGTGRIDEARLRYFTYWYIPVIHAMASLEGFRADPHWIAARVVPPIRSFDAKRALDTLYELGILVQTPEGEVHVEEPRLETEDGLRHIWIREYHRAMIRLSEQALDQWPPERRVTSALTVTVPAELLPEVLARVDGYRRELFTWLMEAQAEYDGVPGEVLQVNFQAFPVTDVRGSEEEAS